MKILRYAAAAFAFATITVIAAPPRERVEPKSYISNLRQVFEEHPDMATIFRWVSTDGDGANTASWEGGVRPSTISHIALFDGESQVSWTTGMAGHGAAIVHTTQDYKGDIGSSGAYLTLVGKSASPAVIAGVFNHSGGLFVDLQKAAGGAATFAELVIGMPLAGVDNAHIDGSFNVLHIRNGGVTLDASLVIANSVTVYAGRTLISEGVTITSLLDIRGGFVDCNISIGPKVYGGSLLQRKLLTSLTMHGGRVNYRPVPFATGDMSLTLWDGVLDVNGNPADVFSAVVAAATFGPHFQLIGATDIDTVGRIDLRDAFPNLGT